MAKLHPFTDIADVFARSSPAWYANFNFIRGLHPRSPRSTSQDELVSAVMIFLRTV
jgi:hypothetical protein